MLCGGGKRENRLNEPEGPPNKPREAGLTNEEQIEKIKEGRGEEICQEAGHVCQKASPNSRIGAPVTRKKPELRVKSL